MGRLLTKHVNRIQQTVVREASTVYAAGHHINKAGTWHGLHGEVQITERLPAFVVGVAMLTT